MAWTTLKEAIVNVIKTNGNQEITGAVMQNALLAMVDSLGKNYQFAGIATPTTNPGAPDQNVFYIAGEGTYVNFNNLVIDFGEIGCLIWDGSWAKQTLEIGSGGNLILDWNADVATTRKQVTQKLRKSGLQISYKLNNTDWINEQYIGTSFFDTGWSSDTNWKRIAYRGDIGLLNVNAIEDIAYTLETAIPVALSYMKAIGIPRFKGFMITYKTNTPGTANADWEIAQYLYDGSQVDTQFSNKTRWTILPNITSEDIEALKTSVEKANKSANYAQDGVVEIKQLLIEKSTELAIPILELKEQMYSPSTNQIVASLPNATLKKYEADKLFLNPSVYTNSLNYGICFLDENDIFLGGLYYKNQTKPKLNTDNLIVAPQGTKYIIYQYLGSKFEIYNAQYIDINNKFIEFDTKFTELKAQANSFNWGTLPKGKEDVSVLTIGNSFAAQIQGFWNELLLASNHAQVVHEIFAVGATSYQYWIDRLQKELNGTWKQNKSGQYDESGTPNTDFLDKLKSKN